MKPIGMIPAGNDVASLQRSMQAFLGMLSEALRYVPVQRRVEGVVAPVAADTAFDVNHPLGDVPDAMTYTTETTAAVLYATADDRRLWTSTKITVRSSVGDALYTVIVIGGIQ